MTTDTPLTDAYASAAASYRGQWHLIDNILHRIFRDHPGHRWEDVYPKVVFIDSVYRAGLSRSLKQRPADQHVAQALTEDADLIAPAIGRVQSHDNLSEDSMCDTIAAHAAILKSVRSRLAGKSVRSFASKYLHFHAPGVVPILDSLAYEHIGRFAVDQSLRRESSELRMKLTNELSGLDQEYLDFAVRFLALYRQLTSLEMPELISVKLVDHMLWLS